jgi:thiamine-phosphate pyrophosphorylase
MSQGIQRDLMPIDYSLYFVADAEFAAGRELVPTIEKAVAGGVTVVQLRGKALPFRDFLDLSLRTAAALRRSGVPLLVNDRVDIALACGAAGVHLGQEDMPLARARKILGPGKIVGLSVNTLEEALEAETMGADYVGLGPAYATSTKLTELPILGPEGIGTIKTKLRIPVVAIGGIGPANAEEIVAAGADGIAVVSAILGADDAERAARELREAIDAAKTKAGSGKTSP